jgi:hypothetical protein
MDQEAESTPGACRTRRAAHRAGAVHASADLGSLLPAQPFHRGRSGASGAGYTPSDLIWDEAEAAHRRATAVFAIGKVHLRNPKVSHFANEQTFFSHKNRSLSFPFLSSTCSPYP